MRALLIFFVSMAALAIGGSSAFAQDSAYPPRPIVVTLSDSSVEVDAPFTVFVDGCEVGDVVDFALEGISVQSECRAAESQQAALVLKTAQGRAAADFTAPSLAGQYVGSARLATDDGTYDLDFALEVTDASPAFELTSASGGARGVPVGSDSGPSVVFLMAMAGCLGVCLPAGFWVVHRSN